MMELCCLRQLEEENQCLTRFAIDLSLDKEILPEVIKKILRLAQKREAVS